jgi:Skp family chaperone for outer membrane proteins
MLLRLPLLALFALLCGCSSVYYDAMEKVGFAKRDLLVSRVQDARKAQDDAKEQFSSALEQLLLITRSDGGELKRNYDRLNREFTRSETRAQAVREKIESVEDVAKALFREWNNELDQYENDSMRRRSEQQLAATQERYETLISLMQRAASQMEPVLSTFRDQVLFLKHNLNARAIAGLDVTARELEADVGALLADMERSIREADDFIAQLQTEP